MPGQLAGLIRAKHPGAYDDMDDATLEKAVLAKYPEYADLAQEPPMKPMASHETAKPKAPSMFEMPNDPLNQPRPAFMDVVNRLPETAMNAALGEVGGRVTGGALRLLGRGLYRAGALPIQQMLGKYGDLIGKGLEEAVPVTKGGLQKAGSLKSAAQATKQAAITGADQTASFRTQGIVDDALARVQGSADEMAKAGLGDPSKAYQARGGRIVSANGPGLKPSELETIKSTVDDTLGPAYKKLRMKEALTPAEQMNIALTRAASDAQETVIPNYRALNKDVMDAEGLRRMIGKRLQGSQGLENALTMAAGPSAIPARIMMLPSVASTAGIAAYKSAPVMRQLSRAALLRLMASHDQPDQQP